MFSRRQVLKRAGVLTVAAVLPGCDDDVGGDGLPEYEYDADRGPENLFSHGVASGDPLADAVILWTRVTDPDASDTIEGFFEVALDPAFEERVAAQYVDATAQRDYTIKVDVTGLDAGTTYYYRFFALGRESVIGRTRTAPTGAVSRLRVAVCSCSSLAHGYFHAYERIAERSDLDLVVHLGDYIYEYATGGYGDVREYEPPHEIITVDDYRMRYAQYRREPQLQEAHRQHPFVVVWDDHEVANNSYRDGAENHQANEGEWAQRRAAGQQVFAEWLPIREGDSAEIIYRHLPFGDLVDLVMLDTRHFGRDEAAGEVDDSAVIDDPSRTLLGDDQEAWLAEQLSNSSATWTILGQQVVMSHLFLGTTTLNTDQWDGYTAARSRLFDSVTSAGVQNLCVLTGDIHSSWAFDIAADPFDAAAYDPATGQGALGVEFVTPCICAEGFPDTLANIGPGLMMVNPHLKYVEVQESGYLVLDITPERIQSDWFHIDDITNPSAGQERFVAAWAVQSGTPHIVEQPTPASAAEGSPAAP